MGIQSIFLHLHLDDLLRDSMTDSLGSGKRNKEAILNKAHSVGGEK